jgi:hypothetical protein
MLTSFIVRESHEFATVDFSGDSFRSYAQKKSATPELEQLPFG